MISLQVYSSFRSKLPIFTDTVSMSEIEQFIDFFDEMGVSFGRHDRSGWTFFENPAPQEWQHIIGVGQAFFLFDAEGRYLGVAQDDPFEFFPCEESQDKSGLA